MQKIVNKFTLRSVLISLGLVAMGVIIILNADVILFWVIKAIGVLLLIDAIIRFIAFLRLDSEERTFNFDLIRAILEAVLGIIALVNPSSWINLLYVLIGVIIVVEGILHIQFVLSRKEELNHWIINFFNHIFKLPSF